MSQFPVFGLGIQGRSPNVTAQKRLNLFFDIQPQGDKTVISAHGTPGLVMFKDLGVHAIRGMYWMQATNRFFVVYSNELWELTAAAVATKRGTLITGTTAGYVSMSDNGTQLMLVDGTYGYTYTPGTTTFSQIVDADFPGADTVTFLDGYFVINRPDTGQFWISNIYDGTAWNGLNFATAESFPDNLVRVEADRGMLVLFGDISIEFWQNSGALDFTYARITGSPSEVGLGARWSVARCNGAIMFLAKTRRGGFGIARLDGYQAVPVSTPELEYNINKYATVADAVAFSYTMLGHDFYQISFPSADETWLYDANSNAWSKLQSDGIGRHRAQFGTAFGKVILVSDYSVGRVYSLSDTAYTDNGSKIIRELSSPHLFDGNSLNQVIVRRMRLDLESGVGQVSGDQGDDPKIMLQISRDGGHTFGHELWTGFGKMGQYRQRAEWRRLGRARDWVFKVRISDPVKVAMVGAYAETDTANK